ncbi:hypothetical protein M9Y10_018662 [Tritrichomonas musculus]|uniref:Uncharacterized protein n=1 Tax=Tritrichomonas musculus TaxID=1915356 RepID=A0ABR2HMB0_9EUKA
MDKENQTLSVAELYVIGKKKYCIEEEGFENWRKDLMKFVTKEFHDRLNSDDRKDQKKANEELSLWQSTTNISFFFRESWGNDSDNKKKALEYLHHAQILERKFNDQYIIQAVNQAIKSCNENKYHFMA